MKKQANFPIKCRKVTVNVRKTAGRVCGGEHLSYILAISTFFKKLKLKLDNKQVVLSSFY